MPDDSTLLRRFADQKSQEAFAELVRRHIGLVFHAALRRTGGRHDLAQDIVQQVFLSLAKHASALSRHVNLVGWLYTSTRFAANHAFRAEFRRRNYEATAHAMNPPEPEHPEVDWSEVRPMLDEVMDRLPKRDREALLMRYFEAATLPEMAVWFRITENGVRKRLDRSLDRLQRQLAQRGISSTAIALGVFLGEEARAAIPPAIHQIALDATLPGAISLVPFGLLHFMNITKAILMGIGVIGTVSLGIVSFLDLKAARSESLTVAQYRQQQSVEEQRLRRLETAVRNARTNSAESSVAIPSSNLPSGLSERSSTAVAARRAAARATARDFLSKNPEAKEQLVGFMTKNLRDLNGALFASAGMSESQINELLSKTVQLHLDTLEIYPDGTFGYGQMFLSPDETRAILGEDGFQQWQKALAASPAQGWVAALATSLSSNNVPLSSEQLSTLTQAVANNSPDFLAGNHVNLQSVDWTNALEQVRGMLSDSQWEQAQDYLVLSAANRQANTLMKGAP